MARKQPITSLEQTVELIKQALTEQLVLYLYREGRNVAIIDRESVEIYGYGNCVDFEPVSTNVRMIPDEVIEGDEYKGWIDLSEVVGTKCYLFGLEEYKLMKW